MAEGRSELRNKVVARVLKDLNYIEQWGSGIQRIKSSCRRQGLREPAIRETGDFVDVELYRATMTGNGDPCKSIGKVSESIGKYRHRIGTHSDQERLILSEVEQTGRVTSQRVQALLGVKEARARRVLRSMVEHRMLDKCGRGRRTHYTLPQERGGTS